MSTPEDFTGERFLPACTGEIWAEHWHRYLFAAEHVKGRDVLDAACGEEAPPPALSAPSSVPFLPNVAMGLPVLAFNATRLIPSA